MKILRRLQWSKWVTLDKNPHEKGFSAGSWILEFPSLQLPHCKRFYSLRRPSSFHETLQSATKQWQLKSKRESRFARYSLGNFRTWRISTRWIPAETKSHEFRNPKINVQFGNRRRSLRCGETEGDGGGEGAAKAAVVNGNLSPDCENFGSEP